jgi:UDP-GlcNAc:undecaprenyl-phosphate/decaprenyl-phosphate GlcNAc-1-phosphate transferase
VGVTREIGATIWPGIAAFCFTLGIIPIFRTLFHRWKILDLPDHKRRIHTTPTPRVGGMAIGTALLLAGILVSLFSPVSFHPKQLELVWRLAPSALVVFATGVLDDICGLKSWEKLMGQAVAAGIACSSGIVVDGGWWAVPVSVLWLLVCTNGFNLIDGMDGLAGGVGFIAAVTISVVAMQQGNTALAVVVLALAGGLLGFLRYNFHPATVFLGDSGSLLLGFVLGSAGIMWSRTVANHAGLLAPALVLSVPLLDVMLAIGRRAMAGRPIFSADLGHVHHRLLALMETRRAAFALYGMCGIVAVFGVLESLTDDEAKRELLLLLYAITIATGAGYLGYFRRLPVQAPQTIASPEETS